MEISRHNSGTNIWDKPATNLAPNLSARPIAMLGNSRRSGIVQQFRMLWENRFRQCHTFGFGNGRSSRNRIQLQDVNGNVDTKLSRGGGRHVDNSSWNSGRFLRCPGPYIGYNEVDANINRACHEEQVCCIARFLWPPKRPVEPSSPGGPTGLPQQTFARRLTAGDPGNKQRSYSAGVKQAESATAYSPDRKTRSYPSGPRHAW